MPDNGEHGPGTEIATVERRKARVPVAGERRARKCAPARRSRRAVPGVRSTRAPVGAPPSPHLVLGGGIAMWKCDVEVRCEAKVLQEGENEKRKWKGAGSHVAQGSDEQKGTRTWRLRQLFDIVSFPPARRGAADEPAHIAGARCCCCSPPPAAVCNNGPLSLPPAQVVDGKRRKARPRGDCRRCALWRPAHSLPYCRASACGSAPQK